MGGRCLEFLFFGDFDRGGVSFGGAGFLAFGTGSGTGFGVWADFSADGGGLAGAVFVCFFILKVSFHLESGVYC